jgi:hypothetical protein
MQYNKLQHIKEKKMKSIYSTEAQVNAVYKSSVGKGAGILYLHSRDERLVSKQTLLPLNKGPIIQEFPRVILVLVRRENIGPFRESKSRRPVCSLRYF